MFFYAMYYTTHNQKKISNCKVFFKVSTVNSKPNVFLNDISKTIKWVFNKFNLKNTQRKICLIKILTMNILN